METGQIKNIETFVKLSDEDGIEIFDPDQRELNTLLTDMTLNYLTSGAVRGDDIEDLELKKTGDCDYKTKIKGKGKILNILPIEVEYEADVNTETGQVKNIKKPFWSPLLASEKKSITETAYTRDGKNFISRDRMEENIKYGYGKISDYREVQVPLDTIIVGASVIPENA